MKRKVRRLLEEAYGRLFGQGTGTGNRRAGIAAFRVGELRTSAGTNDVRELRELNEEWAMDVRRLLF